MKPLSEENIGINGSIFYITLFKLYKSFLLLISDHENMGIGSVTLGSPPLAKGIKAPTASYSLFGVDTKLLSTIVAERAANVLKAPVLLLLFIKDKHVNEEVIKPLVKFLNRILEESLKKIK